MLQLLDLLRTTSSPPAKLDATAVSIDGTPDNAAITPTPGTGRRVVVVGGFIEADADCVAEFREEDATGTIVLSYPLAMDVPFPLAHAGLYVDATAVPMVVVIVGAANVIGRVLSVEV